MAEIITKDAAIKELQDRIEVLESRNEKSASLSESMRRAYEIAALKAQILTIAACQNPEQ